LKYPLSYSYAVSTTRIKAINFCWIYPRDTIYQSSCQPRSYPHISEKRYVADYLITTIKVSKIPQDSIHRRYTPSTMKRDCAWVYT